MANLLINFCMNLNYCMDSVTGANPEGTFSPPFSDAAVVPGPGNTIFGEYPEAVSLGSDGKASCNISALPTNTEQFCINVVFRATEAVSARQTLLESDALPFRIFLSQGSSVHTFHLTTSVKPKNHDWSGPDTLFKQELSLNQWHALSLVYDNDSLALFVDNQLISIHAFPEGVIEKLTGENIYFGTGADGESEHFSGELACFQLYDGIPSSLERQLDARRFSAEWFVSHKYEEFKKTFQTGARTGPLTYLPSIGAHIQHYENCAIMCQSSQGVAFEMHGPIYDRYKGLTDPLSLGCLICDESDTSDTRGRKSLFLQGGIYWSPATGAHPVMNKIHLEYDRQGGPASWGFPTGAQTAISGGFEQAFLSINGEFQTTSRFYYKNGAFRAFVVQGSILSKYLALGGVSNWGFPISNESDVIKFDQTNKESVKIGRQSEFENCIIYNASSGTFEVHGEVRKRYDEIGGPESYLGFPTSDGMQIPNDTGQMNSFQNGSILVYGAGDFAVINPFKIFIGRINSKNAEGVGGGSNDLYIRPLRLTQNGAVIFERRVPDRGDWSGDIVDVNYTIEEVTLVPNDANMRVELYLEIWEADGGFLGGDNRQGTFSKVLDANNGWGFRNNPGGIHTDTFGNINSLRWAVQPVVNISDLSESEKWWKCGNPGTVPLSYEQYGSAFKIDPHPQWWDVSDWIEKAFFALIKNAPKDGNCFGLSLEAIYSRKGKSLFSMPLSRFCPMSSIWPYINWDDTLTYEMGIKHVYQLGADPIWWIVKEFLSGNTHDPKDVFNNTFDAYSRGHHPVICLAQNSNFTGAAHAILPVAWDKSSNPWTITILDPNVHDNTTTLIVNPDNNTFYYKGQDEYAGGSSSGGRLWYYPFSMLDEKQRFPWDVLVAGLLVGGLILVIVGDDGETESITDDEGNDLDAFGARATELLRNGALPSDFFVGIPLFDSGAKPGQILARNKVKGNFTHHVKGTHNGSFKYGFTTGFSEINLASTLNSNETHQVEIGGLSDVCSVKLNSQREKNLTLTVNNTIGVGGDCVQCVIADMPMGPTHGLEATFRPGIAGFDLVNKGNKKNLNLTIRTRKNKEESEKSLVIPMGKGVRINPYRLSTEVLINNIALNETQLTLIPGTTEALNATLRPENATRKTVHWTSSDTAVATVNAVNAKSLVTARAAGSAVVTVQATDVGGASADCAVTVVPGVRPEVFTEVWSKYTLSQKADGTPIVTLDGPNVVPDWAAVYIPIPKVTDTGTKFSADFVELTIRNLDETITDFCVNLDNAADKASYREAKLFWPSTEELLNGNGTSVIKNPGGTTTLRMDLRSVYKEFQGKGAKVVRLKVFIESVPERCEQYDRSGSVEFVALNICDASNTRLTSITLNKTSAMLTPGSTATLSTTVNPSNAPNQTLAWTSSNTAVATVDANGLVTAVAVGSAVVTAIAVDGSGTSAVCAVTVAVPNVHGGNKPELIAESWSGYVLSNTADGTPVITLSGPNKVPDWAQLYIPLPGVTDTGTKFSADFAELTIRNVHQSITDFCVNLDNTPTTPAKEAQLLWSSAAEFLNGNGTSILKNANGTTTLRLNLGSAYNTLKGQCSKGVRLKVFIESVPERRAHYDRLGSVEFVALKLV